MIGSFVSQLDDDPEVLIELNEVNAAHTNEGDAAMARYQPPISGGCYSQSARGKITYAKYAPDGIDANLAHEIGHIWAHQYLKLYGHDSDEWAQRFDNAVTGKKVWPHAPYPP